MENLRDKIEKTQTFAIFGTGIMAKIYASILGQRRDARLVAVAGNSEATTRTFCDEYGAEPFWNSRYSDLLERHPEISSVIIATPENVRLKPVEAAVDYRKNILLEKPFADSWATAAELSKILHGYLERENRNFDICHVLRSSPRFYAMKQEINAGKIGEIRHIFARRNSNNLRVQRVLGKTDLAFWLTPHDVDIMRWITSSEVESLFACSRNGLRSSDDYLIVNLHFKNQVDAVLEISWCGPPVSGESREAIFEVRGTLGNIQLDDFGMNVKVFTQQNVVSTPDTYEDYFVNGLRRGFFEIMISNFITKINTANTGLSVLYDAVEASRVCAMIRTSLDERRIVFAGEVL